MVESGDAAVTTVPRPSATMCVVRQEQPGMSVLMVKRSAANRFMPGAWVFPGGAVDAADQDPAVADLIVDPEDRSLVPWLAAGFRELVEETGIWITDPPAPQGLDRSEVFDSVRRSSLRFPAARIAYFANWVTPALLPVRFDARFFLVDAGVGYPAEPDGREVDAAEYVVPEEALRRCTEGEWEVPFPTRRVLEELAGFDSPHAAIDEWRPREVVPTQPRIRVDRDGSFDIVMPGETGFEDLDDDPPDAETARLVSRLVSGRADLAAEVRVGDY